MTHCHGQSGKRLGSTERHTSCALTRLHEYYTMDFDQLLGGLRLAWLARIAYGKPQATTMTTGRS